MKGVRATHIEVIQNDGLLDKLMHFDYNKKVYTNEVITTKDMTSSVCYMCCHLVSSCFQIGTVHIKCCYFEVRVLTFFL